MSGSNDKHYVGGMVRVAARFRSSTAATNFGDPPTRTLTDPTTVTYTLVEPDGTETDYVYGTDAEVTKKSTGYFLFERPSTQGGKHRGIAVGTGTVSSSKSFSYYVDSKPDA